MLFDAQEREERTERAVRGLGDALDVQPRTDDLEREFESMCAEEIQRHIDKVETIIGIANNVGVGAREEEEEEDIDIDFDEFKRQLGNMSDAEANLFLERILGGEPA